MCHLVDNTMIFSKVGIAVKVNKMINDFNCDMNDNWIRGKYNRKYAFN